MRGERRSSKHDIHMIRTVLPGEMKDRSSEKSTPEPVTSIPVMNTAPSPSMSTAFSMEDMKRAVLAECDKLRNWALLHLGLGLFLSFIIGIIGIIMGLILYRVTILAANAMMITTCIIIGAAFIRMHRKLSKVYDRHELQVNGPDLKKLTDEQDQVEFENGVHVVYKIILTLFGLASIASGCTVLRVVNPVDLGPYHKAAAISVIIATISLTVNIIFVIGGFKLAHKMNDEMLRHTTISTIYNVVSFAVTVISGSIEHHHSNKEIKLLRADGIAAIVIGAIGILEVIRLVVQKRVITPLKTKRGKQAAGDRGIITSQTPTSKDIPQADEPLPVADSMSFRNHGIVHAMQNENDACSLSSHTSSNDSEKGQQKETARAIRLVGSPTSKSLSSNPSHDYIKVSTPTPHSKQSPTAGDEYWSHV
eukprot:GHVO01064338.1.p1 GENE.GHVO01064338.1~~GHVO01064338.1.p1  ORF type:complete len:421 (-),score=44.41 GHVO01064338.1:187-1449(-)